MANLRSPQLAGHNCQWTPNRWTNCLWKEMRERWLCGGILLESADLLGHLHYWFFPLIDSFSKCKKSNQTLMYACRFQATSPAAHEIVMPFLTKGNGESSGHFNCCQIAWQKVPTGHTATFYCSWYFKSEFVAVGAWFLKEIFRCTVSCKFLLHCKQDVFFFYSCLNPLNICRFASSAIVGTYW